MSLSYGAAGDAQVATGVVGVHWLVQMDFIGGTQYLTTAPLDVTVSGNTYLGLGQVLQVGTLSESEDTSAERVTISVPVTDGLMLAGTIGSASTYRGRPIRLYLQLFSETCAVVGTPVHRWTGTMQPVRVTRRVQPRGRSSGRIEMPCTRNGLERARNYEGLRISHAQQLLRYPGDVGLQYMQDLIEKPALWLSRRFQELT